MHTTRSRQLARTFLALLVPMALSFTAGCSSTRSVSMSTVQPAALGFAPEVRKILILDRSADSDLRAGIIESILTAETPEEDRAGLQAMIESFRDQLAQVGRFETVVATETLTGSSLGAALPPALEWSRVDALVQAYGVDAVLSIELFDSDFSVTHARRLTTKKITEYGQTREIEVPEVHVDGRLTLTAGIRIYDPKRRDIVDEERYQRSHHWEASAANLSTAMASLIDKAEATRYLGREIGVDYACKISPMPTRVHRTFYGKSKRVPEMEAGGRHADIADWEGAIAIWKEGLAKAPTREAGQLCFNIAVAYEVLGEWTNARQWAERAYVDYGNDQAHDYLAELRYRVNQESIASQQLGQATP